MKRNIFIFTFITLLGKAQNDTSYIDNCYKTIERKIADDHYLQIDVDTCSKKSYIFSYSNQLDFLGHLYIRNGEYIEYWDDHFDKIKLKGFYFKGYPSGMWQEYYPNGHLLSEGKCKILFFTLKFVNLPGASRIKVVDELNPLDTIYLKRNKETVDSLQTLVIYSARHQFDINQSKYYNTIPHFPDSYPSIISVKIGEWDYYNEEGHLIRREFYDGGRFIKEIDIGHILN